MRTAVHVFLVVLSVACASWGGWLLQGVFSRSEHAVGTLQSYADWEDADGGVAHAPVVTFVPAGGAAVTFTSSVATGFRPYDVGGPVPVAYDPRDPSRAEVNSFVSLYLFPLILLLLAAGLAAAPVVSLRIGLRAARLRASGVRYEAEFVRAEPTVFLNGDDVRYFVVVVRVPLPGGVAELRGGALGGGRVLGDPTAELAGKRIPVFVDPADPKRYLIDFPGPAQRPSATPGLSLGRLP